VAAALIGIADARFQGPLAASAKAAGKLPRHWQAPGEAANNTPEQLEARLAPFAARGLLPLFPLGTDFDAAEQRLVPALQWLKRNAAGLRRLPLALQLATIAPAAEDEPALERMGLAAPRGVKERLLRRLVTLGLRKTAPG
jgi:hypothetical protein